MINLDKKMLEIIYLIFGLIIMMIFSHSYIGLLIGVMCAIPVLKDNNYINMEQLIRLKDKIVKWFENRPYLKKVLFFISIAFCLCISIVDFFDISVEHFSPFGSSGIRYMIDNERILGGIVLLIHSVALIMFGLVSWVKKFFSSIVALILFSVTILYMALDVDLIYKSILLLLTTVISTFYMLNKVGLSSKNRAYSIIMAILIVIGGLVYWNTNSKYSNVVKVLTASSNNEFPAKQTQICQRLRSVDELNDGLVECFINQCSEYFYLNDNEDNMAEIIKHNAELINNKKHITNVKSSYMKRTFAKIKKMCK